MVRQVETGAKKGWQAKWFLWDGGFLASGRASAIVPPHSHHAIQIVIGLDGEVALRSGGGDWIAGEGLIVRADKSHELDPRGTYLALIFVSPESREGRWLNQSFPETISRISEGRVGDAQSLLRRLGEEAPDDAGTAILVHSLVRGLCAGPPPLRGLDPRIAEALAAIRMMDVAQLSLEKAASTVFLSPSRFAHLFTDQVGVPFRRYLLWRKLTRAMLAVAHGNTLSAAAHISGFADSAHLTRACVQMFGMPPSAMMQAGEFFEIPSPFEMAQAQQK